MHNNDCRLLIAEAQKAAKALEVAATKSPTALASLVESRKLIAEAVQSIMSIEKGVEDSRNDASNSLDMEDKTIADTEIMEKDQLLESSDTDITDYNFDTSEWQDLLADAENGPASTFNSYSLVNGRENGRTLVLDDTIKLSSFTELDGVLNDANHSLVNGSKSVTVVEEPELKSATVTKECVVDDANQGSKSGTLVEEPEHKSATRTKKWVRGRLVDVTE